MALWISGVFYKLDAESFRVVDNTTMARTQAFNNSVANLSADVAQATKQLNEDFIKLSGELKVDVGHLYEGRDNYNSAALLGTETLVALLNNNYITGAFFVLGASSDHPEMENAHSAVYIRDLLPDTTIDKIENYKMVVGPAVVSYQNSIAMDAVWKPELRLTGEVPDYYSKPIEAAARFPSSEMRRYGYWSPPVSVMPESQPVILYTLPLLDKAGVGYGVLGVEISLQHFTKYYLPSIDLPYKNSFYAIAKKEGDVLDFTWHIPSGPLADATLGPVDKLSLKEVQGGKLYECRLDNYEEVYCSLQTLEMYSDNSPFLNDGWTLVGFVPKQALHETSTGVRITLVSSILITLLGALAAIVLISYLSTRKIANLSRYLREVSPYKELHFHATGMSEIDELTAAVVKLNKSVINASKTTSKLLDLTLMPLGGFEYSSETGEMVLTSYICRLLGLEVNHPVTEGQWAGYYRWLTAVPVAKYDNVYQYSAMGENGQPQWLRIIRTDTETGYLGIVLDVTKDVEGQRRLAQELDYDALTKLYNRVSFKREAFELIQEQPGKIGAMIFADLDNLKYINDTFGHDVGDQLICKAGEMFNAFSSYGGVVARISGDEFAIYLHGFSNRDEARTLIFEQFARNKESYLPIPNGQLHRIRCSSGIAWYPHDSDNVNDLLKLSDFAMYEAKHSRKGTVFEFDTERYQEKAYLLENREAINRLLDEGLIRFAFQPIVDLRTGEVFAYEALMRPTLKNFRTPLEILAVAEAESKLGQLERVVMINALQYVRDHQEALGNRKVFINSIPSVMMSHEDHLFVTRRFAQILERVVIEITEAENDQPQVMENKLSFIRENNMRLAIDDFGSGYSNEVRMLSIEPHLVKVDMAMIQQIHRDVDKQQLVGNLLQFCHAKGVLVVAEGVEDSLDLAKIIEMGIDYVQGYYVAMPEFEFLPIRPEVKQEILALGRQAQETQ